MIAEEGKAGRKIGETWSAILVPSPAASNTRLRPASYSRCAPAPKRQAGDGRGRRGRDSGGDSFEAGPQPNRLAEAGYRGGPRFRRPPCLSRARSGPGDSVTGPARVAPRSFLCVARQRGNWLANSLRSLQPQNGTKLPVRFSM